MESMLSCLLLCLCAISIPVIQGSGWHFELRMPGGHDTEYFDIKADTTIRELREHVAKYVADRIGKKKNTKAIVMRHAGQLLVDGDGALLADAGVAPESIVEATVENYQQMLFDEYQVSPNANYRETFEILLASDPVEEIRKIDLLVGHLLQSGSGGDSMYNYVMGQIYNRAFSYNKDCSLIEHFFDEFPDITRESFAKNAKRKNAYSSTFHTLFETYYGKTGITLKLIEQIYDAFEGYERDVNEEYDGKTPLEFVFKAYHTQFAGGDEERQKIVQFLRSKGAVDRAVPPPGVRRLVAFQEKKV